jgi:hypothetical protein
VPVAQPLGHGPAALAGGAGADRQDRLFQRRKTVRPVVEEVARLLVRQQNPPARRQGDPAVILARDAPGALTGRAHPGAFNAWNFLRLPTAAAPRPLDPIEELLQREGVEILPENRKPSC